MKFNGSVLKDTIQYDEKYLDLYENFLDARLFAIEEYTPSIGLVDEEFKESFCFELLLKDYINYTENYIYAVIYDKANKKLAFGGSPIHPYLNGISDEINYEWNDENEVVACSSGFNDIKYESTGVLVSNRRNGFINSSPHERTKNRSHYDHANKIDKFMIYMNCRTLLKYNLSIDALRDIHFKIFITTKKYTSLDECPDIDSKKQNDIMFSVVSDKIWIGKGTSSLITDFNLSGRSSDKTDPFMHPDRQDLFKFVRKTLKNGEDYLMLSTLFTATLEESACGIYCSNEFTVYPEFVPEIYGSFYSPVERDAYGGTWEFRSYTGGSNEEYTMNVIGVRICNMNSKYYLDNADHIIFIRSDMHEHWEEDLYKFSKLVGIFDCWRMYENPIVFNKMLPICDKVEIVKDVFCMSEVDFNGVKIFQAFPKLKHCLITGAIINGTFPSDMFHGLTNLRDLRFRACEFTGESPLRIDILDENNIIDLYEMFIGCKTTFDNSMFDYLVDSPDVNLEGAFEDVDFKNTAAPELWTSVPSSNHYRCFRSVKNCSNYDQIPIDWK